MIEKLLQYQEVDGRLRDLENSIRASDEYKKYGTAVKFLNTVNESKQGFDGKAQALLNSYNQLKDEYGKIVEELEGFEDCDEAKEETTIGYFKKSAQDLVKQLSNIENELVKLQQDMQDVSLQYRKLMSQTKNMLEQRDEYKKKYNELVESKNEEKQAIIKELNKIAKELPNELVEKYNAKRKDNKPPVVCEVKYNHCTGCGTELSAIELTKLKENGICECENCLRLIYIKQNSEG